MATLFGSVEAYEAWREEFRASLRAVIRELPKPATSSSTTKESNSNMVVDTPTKCSTLCPNHDDDKMFTATSSPAVSVTPTLVPSTEEASSPMGGQQGTVTKDTMAATLSSAHKVFDEMPKRKENSLGHARCVRWVPGMCIGRRPVRWAKKSKSHSHRIDVCAHKHGEHGSDDAGKYLNNFIDPASGANSVGRSEEEEVVVVPDAPPAVAERTSTRTFCRTLTASDTSMHGGFSVLLRHADECLQPRDMSQHLPTQELVAKESSSNHFISLDTLMDLERMNMDLRQVWQQRTEKKGKYSGQFLTAQSLGQNGTQWGILALDIYGLFLPSEIDIEHLNRYVDWCAQTLRLKALAPVSTADARILLKVNVQDFDHVVLMKIGLPYEKPFLVSMEVSDPSLCLLITKASTISEGKEVARTAFFRMPQSYHLKFSEDKAQSKRLIGCRLLKQNSSVQYFRLVNCRTVISAQEIGNIINGIELVMNTEIVKAVLAPKARTKVTGSNLTCETLIIGSNTSSLMLFDFGTLQDSDNVLRVHAISEVVCVGNFDRSFAAAITNNYDDATGDVSPIKLKDGQFSAQCEGEYNWMVLHRAYASGRYTTREDTQRAAEKLANKLVVKILCLQFMTCKPQVCDQPDIYCIICYGVVKLKIFEVPSFRCVLFRWNFLSDGAVLVDAFAQCFTEEGAKERYDDTKGLIKKEAANNISAVETGEDHENVIFTVDSTLYEYLDGGWKERGKDELKLNILLQKLYRTVDFRQWIPIIHELLARHLLACLLEKCKWNSFTCALLAVQSILPWTCSWVQSDITPSGALTLGLPAPIFTRVAEVHVFTCWTSKQQGEGTLDFYGAAPLISVNWQCLHEEGIAIKVPNIQLIGAGQFLWDSGGVCSSGLRASRVSRGEQCHIPALRPVTLKSVQVQRPTAHSPGK